MLIPVVRKRTRRKFSRVSSVQHVITADSVSQVYGQEENSPGAAGARATSLIEPRELPVNYEEAVQQACTWP